MNKPLRKISSTIALLLFAATAIAQSDTPMTPWGKPSLQGNWDFRTITPFPRPTALADQEVLSEIRAAYAEDFKCYSEKIGEEI